MTTQEAYLKIREHFTKPGATLAKTYSDNGGITCFYRMSGKADDPCRCAAGAIIPDELYDPEMENETIGAVINNHPTLETHLVGLDIGFLSDAQHAHDREKTRTVERFIQELDYMARARGLEIPA